MSDIKTTNNMVNEVTGIAKSIETKRVMLNHLKKLKQ
tara:strand:+ start:98 stop:208 length:111 start_codon:yes stop_codon:yes gene_type:complete